MPNEVTEDVAVSRNAAETGTPEESPSSRKEGKAKRSAVALRVVDRHDVRVPGAVVVFSPSDEKDNRAESLSKRVVAMVDEDGDLPADTLLEDGKWKARVFADGYRPKCMDDNIAVPGPSKAPSKVCRLDPIMDVADEKLGRGFFTALLLGMVVVGVSYCVAHSIVGSSSSVTGSLFENSARLRASLNADEGKDADDAMEGLEKGIASIGSAGFRDFDAVTNAFAGIKTKWSAARTNKAETGLMVRSGISTDLDKFQEVVYRESKVGRDWTAGYAFMWSQPPLRYVEILFWALLGAITKVIMTTAYYMRQQSFYRSGIYLHVRELCCAPLLALVYIMLISALKVDTPGLTVHVSNPEVLAGIAFILAASPWQLWMKLRKTSGELTAHGDG